MTTGSAPARATAVALFIRAVMHGRGGYDAAGLVRTLASAGATDVRTHLTTGNVTLVTEDVPGIVELAERTIQEMAGDRHEVFVRTRDELDALLAAEPFAGAPAGYDRGAVVTFARHPLPPLDLPLLSPRGHYAVFAVSERELFTVLRTVDGSSSAPDLDGQVGQPVTSRAIGTVERVAAALRALPDRPGGRGSRRH